MSATAATCLIILALCHSGFAASHWDYKHEDGWPAKCYEGRMQSPIALSRGIAEEGEFSALVFENYNYTYPVQTKNNGHSAEIRLHVQVQPNVRGGGLPHIYVLDNLHFHWSSEHTLDDYRFPLELHLVHYAREYGNLTNALRYYGGVAVFAVLFDLSPDNDRVFEPLIDIIEKIHSKVNEIEQMSFSILDYLPRDTAGYFRYNGSLTTPDCTEGVVWTVFTNTLPISTSQVKSFPRMRTADGDALVQNYRTMQKLNGRRVYIKTSPIRPSGPGGSGGNYLSQEKLFVVFVVLLPNLLNIV